MTPGSEGESLMPYKTNTELPEQVKSHLPQHAQDIYRETFNHAWEEYKDPDKRYTNESQEEVSHKVAWSAVEKKYKKQGHDWVGR
jgi:cation transport regulator